jgi:septal ring factor EnvC (AmiA/AmiB activator)
MGEENPFAGFDPADEGGEEEKPLSSVLSESPDAVSTQVIDSPAAAAQPAQEGREMETGMDNATTTLMDAPPIPPMNDASGDVAQMIREFERRVATLETRIDELVDARERLERQGAAQTEELRVQRAAIARTQRAVRNLSRPDDDSPTEPALRDPQ